MSKNKTTKTNNDTSPQEPAVDYQTKIADIYSHHTSMRPWMIILAISFILIIATMWGYAIFQKFSTLSWKQIRQSQLADTAKNNWDEVFNKTKEAQVVKTEISSAITQIVAALNATGTANVMATNTLFTTSTLLATSSLNLKSQNPNHK